MKKAAAIFLLLLHLHNLIGYKALFAYLQERSNSSMISSLDKGHYSDADLVEIKLPVESLYHTPWADYERFDGEVEVNGTHYNYVKRKLTSDTLYLLCIPNSLNTKLATAKAQYADDLANVGKATTGKSKSANAGVVKILSMDYHHPLGFFELGIDAASSSSAMITSATNLIEGHLQSFYIPPRQFS